MNRILLVLVFFIATDCNRIYEMYHENLSGVKLTDELVLKYVSAVKGLHKLGANLPQKLATKEEGELKEMEVYGDIEQIIKEEGFADYKEFIMVNAKIAWAWNVSQGEIGIQKFQGITNDGVKQIDEALANPDIPSETKLELEQAKLEIISNWEHNKKYADLTMGIVRPLTNKHDLEIIKRYQKELMEAYTGLPQSTLQEIDPTLFLSK